MSQPVLSIILCSRNDQYMGNSCWRLQTTLNYISQLVYELGRVSDVEIIVTDWGSEIPLRDVLKVNSAAAGLVSIITVQPQLAQDKQKDSPFSEVIALNAAARRVNGQYIGRIDQDTLIGKNFLQMFFEWYEGKPLFNVPLNSALLFANRRSIPYRFAVFCPPFNSVVRFIDIFGKYLPVESPGWTVSRPYRTPGKPYFDAPVGIWLLNRDLWYECGGYDERLIYMNRMEIDMIHRLTKKYTPVHVEDYMDCDFYHLEHYHPHKTSTTYRKMNPSEDSNDFHPNSENWGLIQFPLNVEHYSPSSQMSKPREDLPRMVERVVFLILILCTGVLTSLDKLKFFIISRVRFLHPGRKKVSQQNKSFNKPE
jgi:hypothetical protein